MPCLMCNVLPIYTYIFHLRQISTFYILYIIKIKSRLYMLPHFKNVTPTATGFHEPVYQNLFEVTFTFPTILNLIEKDPNIMMINTSSIKLNTTPELTTVAQNFKYSQRAYITTPKTTLATFDLNFNINVDDNFSIKTWNYMKKWYDLAWNSQTGELHLKKDMVGTIVAHIHDRAGVVIRRVAFQNVQLLKVGDMDFDWNKNEILQGSASFVADYWIDSYYDIKSK
jgi:hypothetical protein